MQPPTYKNEYEGNLQVGIGREKFPVPHWKLPVI